MIPNADLTYCKYAFNDAANAGDYWLKPMCYGLRRMVAGLTEALYDLYNEIETLKKQTATLPIMQRQLENLLALNPGWDPIHQKRR
jgi:hypothetical protein